MNKLYSLVILLLITTHTIQANIQAEIDYTKIVNQLKQAIQKPPFKHSAYNRLAYLTDSFGPRMWGSNVLQLAINHMMKQALAQGFDNVKLDPVINFTKWVRGKESLTLYNPRPTPMNLEVIGLGHSVKGDIRADVIVITDWDELQQMKGQVKGKIVLFNHPWVDYDTNVDYRVHGASQAAKYGALAVLVRSVTPYSIQSVHAGVLFYDDSLPKIPAAAITLEDADMFARMQKRGQKINVHLVLQNQFITGANSSNLIFDVRGYEKPDQIILMGGHIDTWDTGSQTGANDDGGGFITAFEAMRLLLQNGFRARRTIRFIAWSGQELGSPDNGANQYVKNNQKQIEKHIAVFQSDEGSRQLVGFGFSGNSSDRALMKQISQKYLSLINCNYIGEDGEEADSEKLYQLGVPMIKNIVNDTADQNFYFTYHHTRGDTMSIMNPDQLDSNVLGFAVLGFILADLEQTLGRS